MEYQHEDRLVLLVQELPDGRLEEWFETRLLRFLQTYMRLETEPSYQRENLALDPVGGMELSRVDAAYRFEVAGRPYFFCSEGCYSRFVTNPSLYVRGPNETQNE